MFEMRSSCVLLLTLFTLCSPLQEDIRRLFRGEDVKLDLDSFLLSEHPIKSVQDTYSIDSHARAFLNDVNSELRQWRSGLALTEWTYKTNISDHNRDKFTDTTIRFQEWRLRRMEEAKRFNLKYLSDRTRRQLSLLTMSAISKDSRINRQISQLQADMEDIYNTGHTCLRNGSCFALEPEIINIMSYSRDPDLLQEVWMEWRNKVGPNIKQHYIEFIDLLNAGALENGYSDYSQYWKQELFYGTPDLDKIMDDLWANIRPLYLQLHAYVRRKLRHFYGSSVVGNDGTIPAQLLGNMWAQHWSTILDIVSAFPEVDTEAEIEARLKTHVNVAGMFELAERFYKSIGLYRMTPTFWKKSMLIKPQGHNVACHPSAFDMFYPGDYRIKMCSDVTFPNFRTVHHEMGHIEYFMAYADQPTIFREGANAAFHEAVGDTIGLSVTSITHLRYLGLVDLNKNNWTEHLVNVSAEEQQRHVKLHKSTINSLLHMALEKIAFLPFGLLVDKWRWGVMQDTITAETLNRKWWEMRLEFQGVRSPVSRSEKDFDPGAKYHIPANSPYISYFVSYIMQFQMYKSLCQASLYDGPLHECDIHGSKTAGHKLRRFLSQGSSIPWQEQLRYLTGSSQVTTEAIMEYFQPLNDWLIQDNSLHGEEIGWDGASINWGDL